MWLHLTIMKNVPRLHSDIIGWVCSGMGVFAGSLLQVLLVKTEQNTGNYPLALAGKLHELYEAHTFTL